MQAGRLDRRITLLEPGPERPRGPGEQTRRGAPLKHKRWAARLERGGGERLQAATVVGEWQSRFTVRWSRALVDIDHTWSLTDDRGRDYAIESVVEIGRHVGWWLYAVART